MLWPELSPTLTVMLAPIRVVIVEDHEMVRESFELILQAAPDLDVVGTAETLAAGKKLISETDPDVAICDFVLPDGSGAQIAEAVWKAGQHTRVLIITGADDRQAVEAAVAAGCAGFVSKGRSLGDLLNAIRAVAGGAAVFPAHLLSTVSQTDEEAKQKKQTILTRRELEILRNLGQARNAEDIAEELFLSVHTVRNHIRAVLTKLKARSQLEALVIAIRTGLVTIEADRELDSEIGFEPETDADLKPEADS